MQEINIMPHQYEPFNGDGFVCREFLKFKEHYAVKKVIETGSALGGTTKWLCENFDEVHTIEICKQYSDVMLERCKGFNNLTLHSGDSSEKIKEAIQENNIPYTLFFLDAHWGDFCPLQQELKVIAELCEKPIIVIHDFLVPNSKTLGFDSYKGQDFTYQWLRGLFHEIYKTGFNYRYNNDKESEGAKRGLIYITP